MCLGLLCVALGVFYLIAKFVSKILDQRAKTKVYSTSTIEESNNGCQSPFGNSISGQTMSNLSSRNENVVQPIQENINLNPLVDVETRDDQLNEENQYNNNSHNEEIVSTVYLAIFSVYFLSAFTLRFLSERYLMNLHNDFPYLITCFSLSVIYPLCLYAKNVRLRNYAVHTMFSK